jgi:hypothetical protein
VFTSTHARCRARVASWAVALQLVSVAWVTDASEYCH